MKNGSLWGLAAAAAVVGIGVGALLVSISGRKSEAAVAPLVRVWTVERFEVDPAVWGRSFPRQYDSFMRTKQDGVATPHGGSAAVSKLEKKPFLKKAWAGYAFALDYNEERGHHYAQIDQATTKRTTERKQPGACANCHAAETPRLIEELGWEKFNATPYDELRSRLKTGVSCGDCHDEATLALRVSRPAFRAAMQTRGVDVDQASRAEMRTFVCAQCHVEYYFKGESKVLTFPWTKGTAVEEIEAYYAEIDFQDWTHALTGAPMIKIQHPEFELYATSVHARAGVSCADCHMPWTREGAVKLTDHHVRSPLLDVRRACGQCHNADEEELRARVLEIQARTVSMVARVEAALDEAIDALVAARERGADDAALTEARALHRAAQLRWDFVDAENSAGFHSPQESARVLLEALDRAHRAATAARAIAPPGG